MAPPTTPPTTLVLGGDGNFGARICRALAGHPRMASLVAGRNGARAQALAATLGHGAQGLALERQTPDLAARWRQAGAEMPGLLLTSRAPCALARRSAARH
ncbi:hypothetical protein [Verminephrobacter eiseniae]|uniref:hypothetical protein n=1 Tax=Verminephrobacter eiseniae TaxID=364317 RepID=UPI002236F098|nr:hypothetical protein [Verminephrobacter eiseniae]